MQALADLLNDQGLDLPTGALRGTGAADPMDRIARQIDDAERNSMTLLRLVLAVGLTMAVLGLALHLLG